MTSILKVGTIQNSSGNGFPNVGDGTNEITVGSGWVRIASEEWSSSTSSVTFDVIDLTKYINYMFYWYISHDTAWSTTYFRFRTSSGDYTTGQYGNSTYWQQATNGGSASTNDVSYAGSQDKVWMAGNGTVFDSQGQALISIPNYSSGCASIRGSSQLLNRTDESQNYVERFASAVPGANLTPTTVTGFKIFGNGSSAYGSVQVYGLVK